MLTKANNMLLKAIIETAYLSIVTALSATPLLLTITGLTGTLQPLRNPKTIHGCLLARANDGLRNKLRAG